ncbi:hypothetical protein [Mesorhizobium sp.]|uniref:hypothetical protein n=1 Tax=Mesorhizobium sp. TaxID=1871066 RepID=UPI00258110EA|nr:hypothetical protein [Mesorhizobium sp.]
MAPCIRNGASYPSTMTGYAYMTASQKRGAIYIDLGHPARKVAEALAAPNGRST